MQLLGRLNQAALWRTLTRFDTAKIAPAIAIRNTVGVVIPLLAGVVLGNPSAGAVAALGSLNVAYSDSQAPFRSRARSMLQASALVGFAVTIGAISAENFAGAVSAVTLWAIVAGLMVVWGERAGNLGTTTLVTLVVFAARPLTPVEALESGLLAAVGGVLQTLLSIGFWPVHRYEPERRIIGALYGTLAALAKSPAGQDASPPGANQFADADSILATLGSDQHIEAERFIFLLSQAERIRLALLTLRRLRKRIGRDPEGSDAADLLEHILLASAAQIESIGAAIVSTTNAAITQEFSDAVAQFRRLDTARESAFLAAALRDAGQQIDALAGQIRAVAGEPVSAEGKRGTRTLEPQTSAWQLAKLRANLTFESTAFRHAMRLAVCVGLGEAIGRSIDLERTYWIPMTIAIVLRPDFTATFSRGILRIAGTLSGLLLATALFHFLPPGRFSEIALLTFFVFVLRWIGPANYGVFVTALSAFIVLFIAITGVSPRSVIAARAINTVIGGVVALLAYAIWPTWERTRAAPALGDLLAAYRGYFRAVIDAYSGVDGSGDRVDRARMKARLARSNAEALISRTAVEPGTSQERARLLRAMQASAHNFVRAVLAIESALDPEHATRPRPATLEFARDVEVTLQALADSLHSGKAPQHLSDLRLPDLREAHNRIIASTKMVTEQYTLINTETDRIVTNLNTLREKIAAYIASQRK
jgi:uncharacterized membrane protein YccC